MIENNFKKKVMVAMSGGVDSSVAAVLLKRARMDELRSSSPLANPYHFDVIGVFMKFWMAPSKNGLGGSCNRCCSPEAEARARKVAKILRIPFYVFNFEKEFKEKIVDYFLKGYKKGITPNPCVLCNKEIKFGLLLEKALKWEADFVATGHYARTNLLKNSTILENISKIKLFKAKDELKDQSYFLWMLNQDRLRRILFPIGDYTRNEVESLAKKFKLSFLLKVPKSMEICFVQTTINDFLKRYLKQKSGFIVERVGDKAKIPLQKGLKILGTHQGLAFYTIGQRKRIGLPGGPYWVLDKDLKKNLLVVTKNEKDLYKKKLMAKNVNWISGQEPKLPLKVKAKIRYGHKPALATVSNLKSKTYKLIFNQPQPAITPGQSVVFYKGKELLGGGIIS